MLIKQSRILRAVFALIAFCVIFQGHNVNAATSKFDRYLNAVVVIRTDTGIGTGFFVTQDGLIMTNNHVVGSGETVTVVQRNGKQSVGRVISVPPGIDLALVYVPVRTTSWLKLANENEYAVGEEVIAIGTAQGLSWSLTRGIVSGVRRLKNTIFIQTDAAINKGNSGGPLILLGSGKVIGMNTLTLRKDTVEGISFAISSRNMAEEFKAFLNEKTRQKSIKMALGTDPSRITPSQTRGPAAETLGALAIKQKEKFASRSISNNSQNNNKSGSENISETANEMNSHFPASSHTSGRGFRQSPCFINSLFNDI